MVTKHDFLETMSRLSVMAVLMYTFNGIGASGYYGPSSFGTIESVDSFETRSVTDINDCRKQCQRFKSCKLVNYRIRGHICYLVHHVGEMAVSITDTKTAGFVSWTKPESATPANTVCSSQCNVRSCEEWTNGTCKITACGKPPTYGNITINGNIYTVGSKLAYMCLDHENGEKYPHIIECAADGTWTNLQNICGYTNHSLQNGTAIMLKVLRIMVNQTTAMQKCLAEGSSLTTILSVEKFNLLKGIVSTLQHEDPPQGSSDGVEQEKYWIDTHRNETSWHTSDGRIQSMDDDIWAKNSETDKNCARLGHKLSNKKCSRDFCYICEIYV